MKDLIRVTKNGKLVYEGEEQRMGGEAKGFTVRYELLGIIALMCLQFLGAVWWASNIATDVRYMRRDIIVLTETLAKSNNAFYLKKDAEKDLYRLDVMLDRHDARIRMLEERNMKGIKNDLAS